MQRNKVVAKRKGLIAAAAAGGAVAIGIAGAPIIAAVGAVAAAYFGWDWFQFRMKNGMRF